MFVSFTKRLFGRAHSSVLFIYELELIFYSLQLLDIPLLLYR